MERIDEDTRESTADERERERRVGVRTCPECEGRLLDDEEHGETVCGDCGLVVADEAIDRGPEWRGQTREGDSRSRVGAPTTKTMHDEGLSTVIGWQDRDAKGTPLSGRQRARMSRLRTWDERFRTRDHRDRNLKQALGEIDRMSAALGVPEDVQETASVIYRRALDEELLPGRSIEGMSTAALYAACRSAGVPRSLDEVTDVSRVDGMEFKRAYRYLVRELDLAIDPPDPTDYLPKFASELDADEAVQRFARDLLEAARERALHSGKSPVGLAAAALYAAGLETGHRLTQAEVAEVAGVSEVTIRNRYQELLGVDGPGRSETDVEEPEPA
jgi:transcription initiation factor TFIIB